jgi:hypothetical protein
MPAHFESAAQVVAEDMLADAVACGPDPERHVKSISAYLKAGFDQVYINQIGPNQRGLFDFFALELRPRLGSM